MEGPEQGLQQNGTPREETWELSALYQSREEIKESPERGREQSPEGELKNAREGQKEPFVCWHSLVGLLLPQEGVKFVSDLAIGSSYISNSNLYVKQL